MAESGMGNLRLARFLFELKMLYRQIVAADLQVTNEIHWYSFSFVLKIILWSIIQYKFENG